MISYRTIKSQFADILAIALFKAMGLVQNSPYIEKHAYRKAKATVYDIDNCLRNNPYRNFCIRIFLFIDNT